MQPKRPLPALPATPLPAAKRLFGQWWRRQSPARQDRFATLGPLLSVLLFLAAIISAFWYLRNEEIERETESVKRDTEITQQQMGLRLIQNQEALIRIARDLVARDIDNDEFQGQATAFMRERPEITHLTWVDGRRRARVTQWAPLYPGVGTVPEPVPALPQEGHNTEPELTFRAARESRTPAYSRAFADAMGAKVFQLHVPLAERAAFSGTLVVEYSVESLVRHFVPADVAQRHMISVIDEKQAVLASTVTSMPGQTTRRSPIVSDAPLTPALNGLLLRGQGWRTSIGLVNNTLFWMVVALSVLTVWMLLGTWRHMRRRAQIQSALVQETNFRRAMENSMPTGMRAMDVQGRVTYVNAAFCQMTGFSSAEMVGLLPPYPYWPHDRLEENGRLLQQELQGRSPSGGIEVKVMRKEGHIFDARMYSSPLVDSKGQQTGWMTSMTNITEAKRIRDQLSASHERFTTVLEGLDASVSVMSVQQGELLFTNRSYRLWFGGDARGHALLAGSGAMDYAGDGEDSVDQLSGLPAQAHQIIEDAVDLAGIELRRRNVSIHTYVAQHLPELLVDPILIEQVVLNLLRNAAEAIDTAGLATARRHIELRVVPRHTVDEGGVIEFSVTDMGPGLNDEVSARLYEAFFSTKAEGLGIGLLLCRSIIESHRGRIRAQNLYNGSAVVGCRFAFTLPVELPARTDDSAARAEPAQPTTITSE